MIVPSVEEYVYGLKLLMSVYVKIKAFELTRTINEVFVHVKMKAFELTRTINEVFSVVEFESEDWEKYASITTYNDAEVPKTASRVHVGEKDDMVIDSVVELCKILQKRTYAC